MQQSYPWLESLQKSGKFSQQVCWSTHTSHSADTQLKKKNEEPLAFRTRQGRKKKDDWLDQQRKNKATTPVLVRTPRNQDASILDRSSAACDIRRRTEDIHAPFPALSSRDLFVHVDEVEQDGLVRLCHWVWGGGRREGGASSHRVWMQDTGWASCSVTNVRIEHDILLMPIIYSVSAIAIFALQ